MYIFMIAFSSLYGLVLPAVLSEIRHTAGGKDFCIVDGRPYMSGDIIPREHVCHICICHLGKAECSWMNCPSPPDGCTEFTATGRCNPQLYVCSIPEHLRGARSKRSTELRRQSDVILTVTNTFSKGLGGGRSIVQRSRRGTDVSPTPIDEFMSPTDLDDIKQAPGDCHILGVPYQTGDLMGIASSFCLECRCARQNMFCSPKCCFRHTSFHLNASELEAAKRSPKLPLDHPLTHLLK